MVEDYYPYTLESWHVASVSEDGAIEIHKSPPSIEDQQRARIASLEKTLADSADVILRARQLNEALARVLEGR